MSYAPDTALDRYTTLRLGGPARSVSIAAEEDELVQAVRRADAAGRATLILAGGSNVVLPDAGIDADVVLIRTRGITSTDLGGGDVELRVAAGEDFDGVVAHAVGHGLAGLECLSGIPGSTGATPVQNVGAYGQEVADTVLRMRALDRGTGEIVELAAEQAGFGYRTSRFKGRAEQLLLQVSFRLRRSGDSTPLRFGQLTESLGRRPGDSAPLARVRREVLALRGSKGMVLDAEDRDTWSVGSFFTNPVVPAATLDAVADAVGAQPPRFDEPGGQQKTSAAWLIQQAGFAPGYGFDGVALSSRHTLALTNRGSGSTTALLRLARELRDTVEARFAIRLLNEPLIIATDGTLQQL